MNAFKRILARSCHGRDKETGAPKCHVYLQNYYQHEQEDEIELLRAQDFTGATAYINETEDHVIVDVDFEGCENRMIKTFWAMLEQALKPAFEKDASGTYNILSLIPKAFENEEESCMLEFHSPTFWALQPKRPGAKGMTIRMAFEKDDVEPYFYRDLPWLEQATNRIYYASQTADQA